MLTLTMKLIKNKTICDKCDIREIVPYSLVKKTTCG